MGLMRPIASHEQFCGEQKMGQIFPVALRGVKDNRWTPRHLTERLTRGGTRKSGRKDGLRKFGAKGGLVEVVAWKRVGIF